MTCVLVLPMGPSQRVGPSGIVIGRQRDCDLVIEDASVGRRHAHVRLTETGAEIVPLGGAQFDVNGAATRETRALANGDEVRIANVVMVVELRA